MNEEVDIESGSGGFESLEAIAAWLTNECDGIATLEAWQVRDAYGVQRLGSEVRRNITQALKGHGIAHLPAQFPDRAHTKVRIYKMNSAAAGLIEAVLTVGENEDQRLREAAGGSAEEILGRIRELVCE